MTSLTPTPTDLYLTIPALNRVAHLGYLYNERTDQFSSYSVFTDLIPEKAITTTDNTETSVDYTIGNDNQANLKLYSVNANIGASLFSGSLKLEGSGKYLDLDSSSTTKVKGLMLFRCRTKVQQLQHNDIDLQNLYDTDSIQTTPATHIVTGIKWGGSVALEFTEAVTDNDSRSGSEINASFEAEIAKFIRLSDGKFTRERVSLDNRSTKSGNFSLSIHADFQLSRIPTTIQEAIAVMKDVPDLIRKSNSNKGIQQEFTLMPIVVLAKHLKLEIDRNAVVEPLDELLLQQYVTIMEELNQSEMKIKIVFNHSEDFTSCLVPEQIIKLEELRMGLHRCSTCLKNTLIKVRSGKCTEAALFDLCGEYNRGNFSLTKVQSVIAGFTNTIEDIKRIRRSPQDNQSSARENLRGINLCVFHIQHGHDESAQAEFKKLTNSFSFHNKISVGIILWPKLTNNADLISRIVTDTFAYNSANLENILLFVRNRSTFETSIKGYLTLWQKMKGNNFVDDPMVLLFLRYVNQYFSMPNFTTCSQEVQNSYRDLSQILKVRVEQVQKKWVGDIQNQNFEPIYAFEKQSNRTLTCLQEFLPPIVKSAYNSNLSNFENTFACIKGVKYHQSSIEGYTSLFNELKQCNHLDTVYFIRLAFEVQRQLTHCINNSYTEATTQYTKLVNKFPAVAQKLIKTEIVLIKNITHNNECMYASSDDLKLPAGSSTSGYGFRPTFTCIGGARVEGDEWKFITDDHGVSFTIKNVTRNENLLTLTKLETSIAKYDDNRRHVYTCGSTNTSDMSDKWELIPINGVTAFRIRNVSMGEYLYATCDSTACDSTNRRVLTYITKETMVGGDWELV